MAFCTVVFPYAYEHSDFRLGHLEVFLYRVENLEFGFEKNIYQFIYRFIYRSFEFSGEPYKVPRFLFVGFYGRNLLSHR